MEISMLLACASHIGRVQRVLDFADGLSGSPGGSLSRAHLHTLGSPHRNSSTRSATIRAALVTWTSTGKSLVWGLLAFRGEFDDWIKYSHDEFPAGGLPADALRKEKIREDRLRDRGS
ncbi:MAG: hypothetical protein M3021_02880 [Actinomycetota bacterium]|nr:hypothetical protein [Actinomycetota bacterium]